MANLRRICFAAGINFRKRTTTEVKESKTFSELGLPVAVIYDQTYDSLNYELMGESDVETTTNVNSGTRSTLAEINQELQTGNESVNDQPLQISVTIVSLVLEVSRGRVSCSHEHNPFK